MILYAVRDTMYIYLSMITFKASRLPRATSRIKDASLACSIFICPFVKFIQGALFKNNSEHAPSDSKKQNATFLPARAAVLSRGSVQRVRAEVLCSDTPFSAKFPVSRTGNGVLSEVPCSDTHFSARFHVSRTKTAVLPRFRTATRHFKRKNLYRDSWILEKQKHNAATHHFPQDYLYREQETAVLSAVPCSDTPFSAKFPVSRKGYCRSAEVSYSDTPFQEEKPVSRKGYCSRHKKNNRRPTKKSARIGSD